MLDNEYYVVLGGSGIEYLNVRSLMLDISVYGLDELTSDES